MTLNANQDPPELVVVKHSTPHRDPLDAKGSLSFGAFDTGLWERHLLLLDLLETEGDADDSELRAVHTVVDNHRVLALPQR